MKQPKRQKPVTQTLRGFNGPGWELSVTGNKAWVEKAVRKFVPKIQRAAAEQSKSTI